MTHDPTPEDAFAAPSTAAVGPARRAEHALETLIFGSRWLQAPLYAGLVVAELIYAWRFAVELHHLVTHATTLGEEAVMIGVLTLVDMTMVANLVAMIVIGGYATFVSRLNVDAHEDRPDWLETIDASTMKIKLSTSLVGISSIHLLKTFLEIAHRDPVQVWMQIALHGTFLLTTLALAATERLQHGPKAH